MHQLKRCCGYVVVALTGTMVRAAEPEMFGPSPWELSVTLSDSRTLGKVVDPPGQKPPKPVEDSRRLPIGVPVPMRKIPAVAEPVFAEIAGGMDQLRLGRTVHRERMVWREVDCLGVLGWVPAHRITEGDGHRDEPLRWEMCFFSPSGRVEVEYLNGFGSHGSLFVRKDGAGRSGYPLGLGTETMFTVCAPLVFSGDEAFFAVSHGGASYGTEVFVFGRKGKGPFRELKLDLQQRMWDLAVKKGLLSATAQQHHCYMPPAQPTAHGFRVELLGNYGDQGPFNFGPLVAEWDSRGNKLSMITTKENVPPPRPR